MSFTLGGVTANELGIIVEEGLDIPILPALRERTVEIPGRAGVYNYGSDLSSRTFYIPCIFANTTTEAQLEAAIRVLSDLLTDDHGRPRTLVLEFDAENGKYYDVRYSGSISIERFLRHTKGEFTLQLTADNPFAYGPPITKTSTMTSDGNGIVETPTGNVVSYPVITLTNNGATAIAGFTFGDFEYIGTLAVGDVLVIDSDQYTVTKNGVNDIANMDGEFPVFYPNVANIITYHDSESSRSLIVSRTYREMWV